MNEKEKGVKERERKQSRGEINETRINPLNGIELFVLK